MFKRVILVVILLFTIMAPEVCFSASAYTAGETLKSYGAISGDQYGNINEGMKLTRAEMAVILASLDGRSTEAKSFKLHSTFADVPPEAWYGSYVAYAEAMGWSKGVGNGKYEPEAYVTAKETAAFLMNALGKKYSYATVITEAKQAGITRGLSDDGAILRGNVFEAMLDALQVIPEGKNESLGTILGYFETEVMPSVQAIVKTVEAVTAKSFRVTFAADVYDRSKITLTVKRLSTSIPLTVTWNDSKSSVLLAFDSELTAGVYEVKVSENSQEIAEKSVLIESRHIDKIEVISPSVNIINTAISSKGYAAYAVYDQYGKEMTSDVKASDIVFSSSAGTIQGGAGAMVITPFSGSSPLSQDQSISLSIIDPKTGITTSAVLPVAVGICSLSDMKFESIGVDIKNGSTTSIYIPYQAFDSFGFETENYDVITAGLLDMNNLGLSDDTVELINQSNSAGIKVEITRSDTDQSKALIKLTPGNVQLSADTYVTITASTKSGKTSVITLKVLE